VLKAFATVEVLVVDLLLSVRPADFVALLRAGPKVHISGIKVNHNLYITRNCRVVW
jgi:hypothetical protein